MILKKLADRCRSILESDDMDAIVTLVFVVTMGTIAIVGAILAVLAVAFVLC